MKRDEFVGDLVGLVKAYINDFDDFDSNPQLGVNPSTLKIMLVNGRDMLSEIEDSDEAIEDAAGAQGAWSEDSTDYQVKQNPDFYPARRLLKRGADGNAEPDMAAIDAVASVYFK